MKSKRPSWLRRLAGVLLAPAALGPFTMPRAAWGALCCLAVIGATPFDQLTSGINTVGAFVCGTGCTLQATGTGVIDANSIHPTNASADLGRLGGAPAANPVFTGTIDARGSVVWNNILPVPHSANATMGTTDCYGQIHTNQSATGAITITLPSSIVGRFCAVALQADQNVFVKPAGTDQILGLTTAGGHCIESPTVSRIPAQITLWASANGAWMPMGMTNTWTEQTCP